MSTNSSAKYYQDNKYDQDNKKLVKDIKVFLKMKKKKKQQYSREWEKIYQKMKMRKNALFNYKKKTFI